MKKKQDVKKQLLNFLEDKNFSLNESDLKEWIDLAEQYDAQESPVRSEERRVGKECYS